MPLQSGRKPLDEEFSEELHDAVRAGDEKGLADLLRKTSDPGYQLREVLAELLGQEAWTKKFYPYRLKFAPRSKKKPEPPSEDSFIKGVFLGDAERLRAALLGADGFETEKACVLADLLDPKAKSHKEYPYRLEFAGWGKGQPIDRLKVRASSSTRALVVGRELETEKKQYLAVNKVAKTGPRRRSTIMADLAKFRRRKQQ